MASSSNSKCRRLEGKVALVTAATAGIGLATAERLASEGAKIFLCSRRQEAVDKAVSELRAKGYTAAGCPCHVGSKEQRKRFIEEAVKAYGQADILVSNAAVSPAAAAISETPEDAINKILDINIKAAVMLVQEALPHLRAPGASIIFISSVTAYNPPLPIGMYAVSKTALLGLAKGLAAELGPQGVRVNAVAPGIVPTKLSSYLVQSPELARQQAEATHLKRLGTPEDMAAAVAYLASDDAAYMTGETLVVAGGMPSKL
uniref:Dehydrogenase/reductase SDR family member 4 n=1 Tax=Chlamydomonas leiostraca TaxID=1034604 RepID=A0A7S0REP7_9CHLO|mmetsp:Transcript_208/g.483  ORF Transcript_208/g.483 Transcript_208/m.483 type:complete len:260 (+) Transcript_208:86-865(+)|eukprot:CAMPEP_0202870634 /NCGR_PEP_ID=MMETSP1391-20130828/16278_1 /ASSEMBLY_ACC=CAM_ASM_000867 /TAXON_ID=1034604 /ORGANISM="Chlamydomonas leiostraca, Strain SAG 11-49" /LENGTH=259 /DNA_ID=CAMNT_0049551245 /DNA_START=19 /DNA_END=798 /DNA_ORIENTATION=+